MAKRFRSSNYSSSATTAANPHSIDFSQDELSVAISYALESSPMAGPVGCVKGPKPNKKDKKRKLEGAQSTPQPQAFTIHKFVGPVLEDHVDDVRKGHGKQSDNNGSQQSKSYAYIRNELDVEDSMRYKAAGILFYKSCRDNENNKNMQILLGRQSRKGCKITVLGGKREKFECPAVTACREFYEETGALLNHDLMQQFLNHCLLSVDDGSSEAVGVEIAWIENGCYVLYLVDADKMPEVSVALATIAAQFDEFTNEHLSFAQAHAHNNNNNKMGASVSLLLPKQVREMTELVWMNAEDVLAQFSSQRPQTPSTPTAEMPSSAVASPAGTSENGGTSIPPSVSTPVGVEFSFFASLCFRCPVVKTWLTRMTALKSLCEDIS